MKLNTVDSITDALREALTAYYKSNNQSKVLVAQQLFGVTAAKLLLSSLDEVASNVRSRGKWTRRFWRDACPCNGRLDSMSMNLLPAMPLSFAARTTPNRAFNR